MMGGIQSERPTQMRFAASYMLVFVCALLMVASSAAQEVIVYGGSGERRGANEFL